MMGRFEFRSKEIELDFAGVKVTVPGTREYAKMLEEIGGEMVAFATDNPGISDKEATDYMLDVLDKLLGEEAMDKIEREKELDLIDCSDMFSYIVKEVKEYHEDNSAAETIPQPVPMAKASAENRETRRARERAERRAARRK